MAFLFTVTVSAKPVANGFVSICTVAQFKCCCYLFLCCSHQRHATCLWCACPCPAYLRFPHLSGGSAGFRPYVLFRCHPCLRGRHDLFFHCSYCRFYG